MQKKILSLVTFLMLISFLGAQVNRVKVDSILKSPNNFKDEMVELEGFVTQYVEGDAKTTSFYFLKDDWGGIIKVRTSKGRPDVGTRYIVNGPVGIDPIFNEPYISEEGRIPKTQQLVVPPVQKTNRLLIYGLIGGIIVVFFALVFIIMSALNRKSKAGTGIHTVRTGIEENLGQMPQPEAVMEGSTIKMSLPPQGTLKLLPGRFVVVSGDDKIKEIRFYKIGSTEESEITFGRAVGKPYSHIQLKPMTVSAKHAKLVFNAGKYTLTNFSKSNPTLVNGAVLEENGSVVLKNGDKIEMGEAVFQFQAQ
jgi:hypothetical protein